MWPEHQDALRLFMACQSQWQLRLGGIAGVYWQAAQAVNVAQTMAFLAISKKDRTKVWEQYKTMESEALRILNSRAQAA